MYHNIIGLFIIFLFYQSCQVKSNLDQDTHEKLDQIVLIIDKCPDQNRYYHESTRVQSRSESDFDITYIDDDLILHGYITNRENPTKDTIRFPVKSQFAEIEHTYKLFKKLSYLFEKGDTILFSYENDFPVATVINRSNSFVHSNYEKIRADYLLQSDEKFDGRSIFEIGPYSAYPGFLAIRDLAYRRHIELELMEDALKIAETDFLKETELLDSLFSQASISKSLYDFYRMKSQVELDFIRCKYERRSNENTIDFEPKPTICLNSRNDSLIRFGYYHNMLNYLEREDIYSTVTWSIAVSKKTPDFRTAYDKIKQSDQFTEKEKKVLLTKNMKLIIENFTMDDIERYFSMYKTDVNSDALVLHVYNEYQHMLPSSITQEFVINNNTSSDGLFQLTLLNRNNEQIDFREIITKNRGKLIYVDFWATTCLPCLIAIPYSQQLKIDYENKNIEMIYISLDKDRDKWMNSEANQKLIPFEDSYIVDPNGNNAMLDKFNIQSIPRYMLFDENGRLLQNDSYGPKTKEIREIFDKYIPT